MTIVPGEPHPERSESASLVSPKWTRMRFVRCEACGAKALVAASGCPHCGTSLGLRDSRGEPLALAHCPTCDLYYPRKLGECRWCGTEAPTFKLAPYLWGGAGFLLVSGMAWAAWQVHSGVAKPQRAELAGLPTSVVAQASRVDTVATLQTIVAATPPDTGVRDTVLRDVALLDTSRPLPDANRVSSAPLSAAVRERGVPAESERPGAIVSSPVVPPVVPPVVAPPSKERSAPPAIESRKPNTPARIDTRAATPVPRTKGRVATPSPRAAPRAPSPTRNLRWVSATVRKWANVRAAASHGSRIVAAIGPDTRVQLGETRDGWQRVRARDISGWVDQKQFVAQVHGAPPRTALGERR